MGNDIYYPYKWSLKDGYPSEKNNLNVFGTFVCGGGSTMGYKLAGFNHLGGVEIDKKVAEIYKINHNPKYFYTEDLREFNKREDLPKELYNLDILDGSPPCSTFSLSGGREDDWGKKKKFTEGQSYQTLDDLVFVYCNTIIKLRPKVFILENVTGIIKGNAKLYSKKIIDKMTQAGYVVQVFCLNAATMGVPQRRERVFFIGYDKKLNLPLLSLNFNQRFINFKEIKYNYHDAPSKLSALRLKFWNLRNAKDITIADTKLRLGQKGSWFNHKYLHDDECLPTIMAGDVSILFNEPRTLTHEEYILAATFPMDYNFKGLHPRYLAGMSVPPVMMAQIAHQIYLQWFARI